MATRITEQRLDVLREEAARRGELTEAGVRPAGAPFPQATPQTGYYGLPLLKRPVWTWEIPAYFFAGGAAGAAAVVAEIARATGASPDLVRDARWIAAAGGAVSPPLLIADLGRPARFLYMLRVFKPQSPMSVGAWTVLAFSNAAAAAAFADLLAARTNGALPVRVLGDAAGAVAAATGLGMATYTGVLVGATAIPAWSRNVTLLPLHFGVSALASASALLELRGHADRALNALGIGAAAVETYVALHLEMQRERAFDPLHEGTSGATIRAAGLLSGPVPLVLRLLAGRNPALRRLAALSSLAGSLLTRIGWLQAGRASADDPRGPLQLEGHH